MNATTGQIRVPAATYRLQFNARFTFRDARAIVDYLHALGVTDCYASSYLKAVPGSGHGYDVADPTRLNPEIGTDEEYDAWITALKARHMGGRAGARGRRGRRRRAAQHRHRGRQPAAAEQPRR